MSRTERETEQGAGGEDEFRQAFRKACDYLSRRPHSRGQLRRKLGRKFDADCIERVLDRLVEVKYQDDFGFAVEYVSQRLARSPRGYGALIAELGSRGVDQSSAGTAVDWVLREKGLSEDDLAALAVRRRLPGLRNLDTDQRRARLARFLAGRAFSAEAIRRALEQVSDE